MMTGGRWLLVAAAAGAGLAWRGRRLPALGRLAANVRDFDLPTAGLYDTLWAALLEGFYGQVAREVAAAYPAGRLLEVGSGPGRLAVRLARAAPSLTVTGIDLSPAMVERAARRAFVAGHGARVRFAVGDAAALPFPDARFDAVVSTLSLHHWTAPAAGLAEVHRALAPGGRAWVYDLPVWAWRLGHGVRGLGALVAASPFGGGRIDAARWPGPLPTFSRIQLQRR